MNNRPDLLTEATLVRAFKIYLEQIKTPTVTLSPATTSMIVDPSVNNRLFRSNRSVLSLQLLFFEMFLLIKKNIKLSLLPKRSFTILFVEQENTHQLEPMIWILSRVHLSI